MVKATGLKLIQLNNWIESAGPDCKEVYDGNLKHNSPFGHFRARCNHRLQIQALTFNDGNISPNNRPAWKLGIELKK